MADLQRVAGRSNNPNWPPQRRLTEAVVRAILNSKGPAPWTVEQLAAHHIIVSVDTVKKIWDGTRWPHVSRVGTMWDPDPATAPPDAPRHQPGYRRRKAKRWARRPAYLTRSGRLRKGYHLTQSNTAA